MPKVFDIAVLGLGAMGSAAVYQLSKSGQNILGIDQFSPPHVYGSSHGETRITRQAIGEGEEYVPLVLRSYEIWHELEAKSNKNLLTLTGGLILANAQGASPQHGKDDFFGQTVASAKKFNIQHSILENKQIKKDFPQFQLTGQEIGYFENNAGFLRPEECIRVQIELAQANGAELKMNEKVLEILPRNDKVIIRTAKGEYEAGKLIVSAGPWVSEFLEEKYNSFKVYRQVLYWFDAKDSIDPFLPQNFPVFIWVYGDAEEESLYGFPAIDGPGGGVKIASEQYDEAKTPEELTREVSQGEIERMYQKHLAPRFPGVSSRCLKAASCLYTVAPGHRFIIDFHPENQNIIIASPCSGHGFKHSAAIGEMLAEMALKGESSVDRSKFTFGFE